MCRYIYIHIYGFEIRKATLKVYENHHFELSQNSLVEITGVFVTKCQEKPGWKEVRD